MADEQPDRVGTVIAGKYRVEAELGRGGMGAVYRVTHVQVKRQFALKVLHRELASNREAALRFLKEAQVASRIGHPAILDVFDVGETEQGDPFMLMELLRGESLAAWLDGQTASVDQATWIASELLEALAAAHEVGVLHRDVKPQNVFLAQGADGRRTIKLLDFGIAKFQDASEESALTRTGKIVGSPLYMAPEQARAETDIDARVDVWSVGATLFEMLTGAAAHRASSPVAVLARVLTEPAPLLGSRLPNVRPELEALVERSLKIARAERFASAVEMLAELQQVRTLLGLGEASPPTFAPRRPSLPRPELDNDRDRQATRTSAGTSVTNVGQGRSRSLPLTAGVVGLLALAAGVLLPLVFSGFQRERVVGRSPSGSGTPVASGALASHTEARASAPPAPSAAELSSVESPRAAEAKRPASDPSAKPRTSRPTCGPSEVLSSGHCCPLGLVWQNARCERPLATSF